MTDEDDAQKSSLKACLEESNNPRVSIIIYCNSIMKLFGISLSNPFAKSVKRSSRKHHRSSTKTQRKKYSGKHLKKHSSKKRRNKSRKYKMRGG
jgi:hypothetical protein